MRRQRRIEEDVPRTSRHHPSTVAREARRGRLIPRPSDSWWRQHHERQLGSLPMRGQCRTAANESLPWNWRNGSCGKSSVSAIFPYPLRRPSTSSTSCSPSRLAATSCSDRPPAGQKTGPGSFVGSWRPCCGAPQRTSDRGWAAATGPLLVQRESNRQLPVPAAARAGWVRGTRRVSGLVEHGCAGPAEQAIGLESLAGWVPRASC
jgi:hypothetical protein